jgi:general secretion pathway protein D
MYRYLPQLLAVLVLAGCAAVATEDAGYQAFQQGRTLIAGGQFEAGLAQVQEAARLAPANNEYRVYYYRQRDLAVGHYLALAESRRAGGALEDAAEWYRRAAALDATNARAAAGLQALEVERRHRALLVQAEELLKAGSLDAAGAKAREVLVENSTHRDARALLRRIDDRLQPPGGGTPRLAQALRKPVTLEFRDTPLRTVFEILSKHSGLNFLFDREVPADAKATVFVKNTPLEDVVRFVLMTHQLERKVLNDTTLLIYPNTPAKSRDYRELVVRTFYLANADVKQTANMIRQMVRTRDLFFDEKLNLLVMRDTPEAVRMAERLIANQDLGEPEVMLEVEVLEVGTNLLQQLGLQWPESISYSLLGPNPTVGQVGLPGSSRFVITDPLFVINLSKQDGRTNVLANPRIRVKNREKARVHIGDKVPVITTTAGATGFVSESVNYLDVGLKLEVEPQVSLDDDVGIKVGLEVSNISQEVKTTGGTVAYQVGTRNANTTLRLRDGETQVLAGLISDEDRRSAVKVPGMSSLPVLGRLFGTQRDTVNKSEIVLLITPRVVRNLARPDLRFEEFPAGTEGSLEGGSASAAIPAAPIPSVPPVAPPPMTQPAPPPAITTPPAPPGVAPPAPVPGPAQQPPPFGPGMKP